MTSAAPALDILNHCVIEIKAISVVRAYLDILHERIYRTTTLQSGMSSPSSAIDVAIYET